MTERKKRDLYISEATGQEGSWCDTGSRHKYENGNITDASAAEAEAIDAGDDVIWVDAPIDEDVPYDVSSGQTFNIISLTKDGQGVPYQEEDG